MQLELFCNPNKVIEFATEDLATSFYYTLKAAELQQSDFYLQTTGRCENIDFWLFMTVFDHVEYDSRTTPTYVYVEE